MSIWRCSRTFKPIIKSSIVRSSSPTGNRIFLRESRPEERCKIVRGAVHGGEQAKDCTSSPPLSATLSRMGWIFLILPIPRIAARSATFGDTMLSSLPLSQRRVTSIDEAPSVGVMAHDGVSGFRFARASVFVAANSPNVLSLLDLCCCRVDRVGPSRARAAASVVQPLSSVHFGVVTRTSSAW